MDAEAASGWFVGDGNDGNDREPPKALPSKIRLPPGVCKKLTRLKERGRELKIGTTTACPTKLSRQPPCGAWSSVETPAQDDAGAPPAEASTPDAGKPNPVVQCSQGAPCPTGSGDVCCIGPGPQIACVPERQCQGIANRCDGDDDCGSEAPKCCQSLANGASCKAACGANEVQRLQRLGPELPLGADVQGVPGADRDRRDPRGLHQGRHLPARPLRVPGPPRMRYDAAMNRVASSALPAPSSSPSASAHARRIRRRLPPTPRPRRTPRCSIRPPRRRRRRPSSRRSSRPRRVTS